MIFGIGGYGLGRASASEILSHQEQMGIAPHQLAKKIECLEKDNEALKKQIRRLKIRKQPAR